MLKKLGRSRDRPDQDGHRGLRGLGRPGPEVPVDEGRRAGDRLRVQRPDLARVRVPHVRPDPHAGRVRLPVLPGRGRPVPPDPVDRLPARALPRPRGDEDASRASWSAGRSSPPSPPRNSSAARSTSRSTRTTPTGPGSPAPWSTRRRRSSTTARVRSALRNLLRDPDPTVRVRGGVVGSFGRRTRPECTRPAPVFDAGRPETVGFIPVGGVSCFSTHSSSRTSSRRCCRPTGSCASTTAGKTCCCSRPATSSTPAGTRSS